MLLSGLLSDTCFGRETYTLIAQAKEDAGNSSNWLRNSPLEKFALRYIGIVTDLIGLSQISTLYQPRFLSKYNSLSDLTPALTLACHDICSLPTNPPRSSSIIQW